MRRLIRQLFEQVDRKRTQSMVSRFLSTISLVTPHICEDMQCNEGTDNTNKKIERAHFLTHTFDELSIRKV